MLLALILATSACEAQPAAPRAEGSAQVVRIDEMAVSRAAHQATRLPSGKVLVTGGCAGQCDVSLDEVEVFDPASGGFQSLPPMAEPRNSHAAVALEDGRVLVAGGWSGREVTASVELFDEASGRFNSIAGMTQARAVPKAVRLVDGRVLVTGGQTADMVPLDSAEIIDPATGRSMAIASMGSPRLAHAAVALGDGRVLITGGIRSRRGEVLRSAEIFDPATGRFEPTGDMAFPRQKHAAVRLGDGRVMILGGTDSGPRSGRYRSTELYDPATGRFSTGPDMLSQRYKLPDGALLLPSGDVLVVAGAPQVERFDSGTGRFVALTGELDGPHEFATATLLDNGEVLVLGGYDEQIETSSSAWRVRTSAY
ncbi:MAG: hypothetical protein M3374_06355 [Pseudomonadota bacterium]|nr:hypothetical protein [Pseudomonadota bacterium]